MNEEIVGIDLGTTNSEIALYRNSRPDVLADQRGRVILPSVVGVDEAGELLVGEEVRNQYILYPDRTVRSIKRLMGSDRKVQLAEKEYSPQEISAIILKRLKEIAEQRLGRPVRKAVITVPAFSRSPSPAALTATTRPARTDPQIVVLPFPFTAFPVIAAVPPLSLYSVGKIAIAARRPNDRACVSPTRKGFGGSQGRPFNLAIGRSVAPCTAC